MQNLDYRVVGQAMAWLQEGRTVWLCTVLSTFGSSPREPGSLMVANASGEHLGSLSGGCVEEDFLERLVAGEYQQPAMVVRYGGPEDAGDQPGAARVKLPCGGVLEVLVERMAAGEETLAHLEQIKTALGGEHDRIRQVRLADGHRSLSEADPSGPRVQWNPGEEVVRIRVGPVAKLILAGYSSVAEACAGFALTLGYQVVLCDPRSVVTDSMNLPDVVEFIPQLPSLYIASPGACTPSTAVVAVTHDPRIDDLAMMAAVKTSAGYIGVMGSRRTSQARAERLARTGGLAPDEISRIHMPIGLDIGSKTPAEIALAIMADVLRVRRGRVLSEV